MTITKRSDGTYALDWGPPFLVLPKGKLLTLMMSLGMNLSQQQAALRKLDKPMKGGDL